MFCCVLFCPVPVPSCSVMSLSCLFEPVLGISDVGLDVFLELPVWEIDQCLYLLCCQCCVC